MNFPHDMTPPLDRNEHIDLNNQHINQIERLLFLHNLYTHMAPTNIRWNGYQWRLTSLKASLWMEWCHYWKRYCVPFWNKLSASRWSMPPTSPTTPATTSTNYRNYYQSKGKWPPTKRSSAGAYRRPAQHPQPLIEAEATLNHIANNHDNLPMRHVQRELTRAEHLLKEGRSLLKSWANDPEAPGALAGTAATRNTLDGIDWALLAAEEGGVANLDEALKIAAAAAQRSNGFMMELLQWLQGKLAAKEPEGSPSPKRARRELASGSTQRPRFREQDDQDQAERRPHGQDPGLRREPERPLPHPTQNNRPMEGGRALRELRQAHPLPLTGRTTGDATPYQVLRAQQIIEGILPFLEQEVAATLSEAHSLLFSWTSALWGEPVMLVASEDTGENSPNSTTETLPWHPAHPQGDPPLELGCVGANVTQPDDTCSQTSHRRRRMHAAMEEDDSMNQQS